MSKLGGTIDKKVHMSNLVAGRKSDAKGKFGRLGLNSKVISEEVKNEQTAMMVQNILQSKPLLFRRFVPTKAQ